MIETGRNGNIFVRQHRLTLHFARGVLIRVINDGRRQRVLFHRVLPRQVFPIGRAEGTHLGRWTRHAGTLLTNGGGMAGVTLAG